ncbi:MAG: Alkaline phosphatase [Bacteroidota bacterium]|jgi:hypothetical protein
MQFKYFLGFFSLLIFSLSSVSCSPEDGLDGTNGRDGLNGVNGADGTNGLNSLIKISIEPAGSNCPSGGFRIASGLDQNTDNTLDANEVSSLEFICNAESENAPYVSYVSLISQNGTEDPSSIVLQNTANIAISWSRIAQGIYTGQLSQSIDIAKTVIFYSTPGTHTGVRGELIGTDQIRLELQYGVNFFLDDFENLSFELRIYE